MDLVVLAVLQRRVSEGPTVGSAGYDGYLVAIARL
jgi:hypothetical protein